MSSFDSDSFDVDTVSSGGFVPSAEATFFDLAERALTESLDVIGETFRWNGTSYDCSIDHAGHVLTTQKSLFAGGNYPKRGDVIIVSGKKRQVTKLNNAAMQAAAGGMVEDQPFVDDPSDPSIDIEFDKFIGRKS